MRCARLVVPVLLGLLAGAVSPCAAATGRATEAGASRQAVSALRAAAGTDARLHVDARTGWVRLLGATRIEVAGESPRQRAASFLESHGAAFGLRDAAVELGPAQVSHDVLGHAHVRRRQLHRGLPVVAGEIRVHLDASGAVVAAGGSIHAGLDVDPVPRVGPAAATEAAVRAVQVETKRDGQRPRALGPPSLVVLREGFAARRPGEDRLVHELEVASGPGLRFRVRVDAHDGSVVEVVSLVRELLERRVHQPAFGTVIWDEGDPLPYATGDSTNDDQVNALIDVAEDVHVLFLSLSGGLHDSWDGEGATMHSEWKPSYLPCPNAWWNGLTTSFCDGVAGDDIVAHEWAHAYTEATHELVYQAQPGALNESYSDIFGEVIDLLNGLGTDAPEGPRTDDRCSTFGGMAPPLVTIEAPPSLAGPQPASGAAYNPPGPSTTRAPVELVNDGTGVLTDGCEAFVGFTPGRLALVDRGGCIFPAKTANAQAAGAAGVLVVDFDDVTNLMGGAFAATIPSAMIGQTIGASLRAQPPGTAEATIELRAADDESPRWLIGEDAFASGVVRDMWNPACFGHPAAVSDSTYACGPFDNDGVHWNSAIPNRGFALLVDGGVHDGASVGGLGMTKAVHVYWRAMSVYQVADSDFADHAAALRQSCLDLVGADLADLMEGTPSGEVLGAADCEEVDAVIEAVELESAPACSFAPLLAPGAPALPCGTEVFREDFETDVRGRWFFSDEGVAPEYEPRSWERVSELPDGRGGWALRADDSPDIGNCVPGLGDQSRVLRADSPPIVLDGDAVLTFDHLVATEFPADGGNLAISVNGGPFQPITVADFLFNGYVAALSPPGPFNANPLAGQPAFTGSDNALPTGSWGTSQVSLAAHAGAGDTIQVRFQFGADACSGLDGWYVDDVRVCTDRFTAGRVPGGGGAEPPLTVQRSGGAAPGSTLELGWSPSCHGPDADYRVYEGALGDFASHVPVACTTDGATRLEVEPSVSDRYYLIAPVNGEREGSLGLTSDAAQRPSGPAPCSPRSVGECGG